MTDRRKVHERFQAIVQRGIERADREHAEHLATLRPSRAERAEARRRSAASRRAAVGLSRAAAE